MYGLQKNKRTEKSFNGHRNPNLTYTVDGCMDYQLKGGLHHKLDCMTIYRVNLEYGAI